MVRTAVSTESSLSLYYLILSAKIATGTKFALTNYKVKRDRCWRFSRSLVLSPSLSFSLEKRPKVYAAVDLCCTPEGSDVEEENYIVVTSAVDWASNFRPHLPSY